MQAKHYNHSNQVCQWAAEDNNLNVAVPGGQAALLYMYLQHISGALGSIKWLLLFCHAGQIVN